MLEKPAVDVLIDVTAPPTYTIPESNLSGVLLEHETSDGDIHYFKGTASLSKDKDFYFEITLKQEHSPKYEFLISSYQWHFLIEFSLTRSTSGATSRAVWLGFVNENWLKLSEDGKIEPSSSTSDITWSYQPLLGSLSYGDIVYAHDPISGDGDITIGFGLRSFKDHEDDCWSVFYMKDNEHGKEIVRKEPFPVGLYPAIRLEQSSSDVTINSTSSFKYQNCQPLHIPHRLPIGLIKCSPDRRYAACYSGPDLVLSLWRLYGRPAPEFVQYISVPNFDFKTSEEASDALSERPFEQFTLAVSNTVDDQLPQLALSRYHAHLNPDDLLACFLKYTGTNHRHFPQGIAGHLHLLDDGMTLLVLGVNHLFVVNMKSQSLLHIFNTNHLEIKASALFTKSHRVLQEDRQLPLLPLGHHHFLWHRGPDHVTMWDVSTGRLVQTFRLSIQSTDKYDYDKDHCLIAFYSTDSLEIFTTQTGISLYKAQRNVDLKIMKPIGVKFVAVGDALRLLTVDGNNEKCTLRVLDPLTGCVVMSKDLDHTFGDRLKFGYIAIGGSAPLSVSIITPLMATVARLTIEGPPVKESPSTVLDLKKSSAPSEISRLKIEVVRQKRLPKEYVIEISKLDKDPVIFYPQTGDREPTWHWLSNGRFVVVGLYAVQIVDGEKTSARKLVIDFVWCPPSRDATITGVELLGPGDGGDFRQMKLTYQRNGTTYDEEDIVDITLSISSKHAARFIQYSGDAENRTIQVYKKALNQSLKSAEDTLQLNEVDFKTKTSTFGHIVRGPPPETAELTRKILDTGIYRPIFCDNELWNRSALIEALDTGDLDITEDIVRYCLETLSKKNVGLLEPGYVAIVMGALPTIARAKPKLAVWIAQYVSHIPLKRFITVVRDVENDTRKSHVSVFARIEQLSKFTLKTPPLSAQSPLQQWWVKRQQIFLSWWNKERLPQAVQLCVSPLYGLNNYKADVSSFHLNATNLSVFAQLAFRQSPVFDEPAFQAVVQYKWDTFARWYHMCLLFLYTSYALIYMIAVSISPTTLAIPGIAYTLIVLTIIFIIIFDIRPLLMRWDSLTYWSSIYQWIDRLAFILVLVSTIVTLLGYESSVDFQAWTVLTLWMFVVFNFRVFRGLGLFFTLLINILTSLGWLAILMTTIIFGFSHAMWILLRDAPPPSSGNPFVTIDGSLKSLWEFLGGDFAVIDGWYSGRSTDIMRVLFTFISTIVLLNVLIALLNNVYTDKQEIARKTWIRNRAEFIATVEVFMLMPKQRLNVNWFPAVVFYEVTIGEYQDYCKTVKDSHPWAVSEVESQVSPESVPNPT